MKYRFTSHQLCYLARLSLMTSLFCIAGKVAAQANSDLFIVLDPDGIGYTAQLTLFADDELLVTQLPPQRTTIKVEFSGSGSALYRRAHENEPDKITLVSGSAFTRFRHRFDSPQTLSENDTDTEAADDFADDAITDDDSAIGDAPDDDANGDETAQTPVLFASLDQYKTTMTNTESFAYSVSWLLPPNLELISYYPTSSEEDDSSGSWTQDGPLLTFTQSGGVSADLKISYRLNEVQASPADNCLESIGPSEWCSPDVDEDSVPDYRDLCVAIEAQSAASGVPAATILADSRSGTNIARETPTTSRADSLGCDDDTRVVLSDVKFESGQTYLNVKSRTILDKVATAIQRHPERLYRIAAYTDNTGYVDNNQRLSKDRADSIRHYLMLRGIGPNQLQATGFGEADPKHDNRTAAGRRANRRVELQRLN